MEKAALSGRGFFKVEVAKTLLDLAFFVIHVLAHDGIIFTHDHFLGHGARVFLGHIEMARSRRGVQTNLDCGWLGHCSSPAAASPRWGGASNLEARLVPVSAAESTAKGYFLRPVHHVTQTVSRTACTTCFRIISVVRSAHERRMNNGHYRHGSV